jgi:hypothetical protein
MPSHWCYPMQKYPMISYLMRRSCTMNYPNMTGCICIMKILRVNTVNSTGVTGTFPGISNSKMNLRKVPTSLDLTKVSMMKLAVAKKIKAYVLGGGFLFAMCSATDTYDIALAANGVDICEVMYDGDPADPMAQKKLDFDQTFAFQDFQLIRDPLEYEFSTIDQNQPERAITEENDFFTLFEFSAKWDPIPTMLTQNHNKIIKGFMGQTTAL